MLSGMVLSLLATVGVIASVKPTYWATATVLVTSQRISERFVQSTVEAGEFEKISAIQGELLSRGTLGKLVETYDLYGGADSSATTVQRVGQMRSNITFELDDGQGRPGIGDGARIYAISFSHGSPDVAAEVANDLASRFTLAHLQMRGDHARITTRFVRRELERTEKELQAQEHLITQFKQRNRGELPEELQANLSRLERLHERHQALALQIAAGDRNGGGSTGAGERLPLTPNDRLVRLRRQLEEQRAFRTAEHPTVVSLERQLSRLKEEIAKAPPPLAALPEAGGFDPLAPSALRIELGKTEAAINVLDAKVARMPQHHEQLAALERRAEALRESYRDFLHKVEEAELSEAVELAQQGERATVLDRAIPPTQPETPLWLLGAAGVVLSLGIALGLAILLELLDGVILRSDQLEEEFGLPVLGTGGRIS